MADAMALACALASTSALVTGTAATQPTHEPEVHGTAKGDSLYERGAASAQWSA
jgi:hypothetical protein